MEFTETIFRMLESFLHTEGIIAKFIHITGPNQSGKSMFIKDFVQYHLEQIPDAKIQYIDTETKFATNNYRREFTLTALEQIGVKIIKNLSEFAALLDLMNRGIFSLTFQDLLVIDSLSQILKGSIADANSGSEYRAELQQFYIIIIAPLLQLAHMYQIPIICTHHMSYNKESDASMPYEYGMMEKLPGLWIYLNRELDSHQNNSGNALSYRYSMKVVYSASRPSTDQQTITMSRYEKAFEYRMDHDHFQILNPM